VVGEAINPKNAIGKKKKITDNPETKKGKRGKKPDRPRVV